MDETLRDLAEYIAATRGDAIDEWTIARSELTVRVAANEIVPFVRFLRDDARLAFVSLIDVCGVDWPQREKRFDVVYHFLSPRQNVRMRLKIMTDETTPVPSITPVFPGADWFEREAYDLYGFDFPGHPNLHRILCHDAFVGHALRKDYAPGQRWFCWGLSRW